MMLEKKQRGNTRGFIALTSVLVLSAILLSISIGVSSRSISGSEVSISHQAHEEARALAYACAQWALVELQRTLSYIGDEHIIIDSESCELLPITGTGVTDRVIQASSTVRGHTHKVEIEVSKVSPDLIIGTWEDVVNF